MRFEVQRFAFSVRRLAFNASRLAFGVQSLEFMIYKIAGDLNTERRTLSAKR